MEGWADMSTSISMRRKAGLILDVNHVELMQSHHTVR